MTFTHSFRSRAAAIAGAGIVAVAAGPVQAQGAGWEPTKTVEFIVPAGTGGGADQMARLIQAIIAKHNLMKQSMVVINKGGGAGAEGFLEVKGAKGDPHKIIITLSNLFTTPLATGVPFNWKDLTPVRMMALDQFVLWVQRRRALQDRQGVHRGGEGRRPQQVQDGRHGLQAGGPDHHRRAGEGRPARSSPTFPFKGGGDVATQLVGKHVDSSVNNPIEAVAQWRARQAAAAVRLRRHAHAVQGEGHRQDVVERHPDLQGVGRADATT